MNECLKKIGLNVVQARRMVYDTNEWREFVRVIAWGVAMGKNQNLMRRYTRGLLQLYETLRGEGLYVAKSTT